MLFAKMTISLMFTGHMVDLPGRGTPRFPPSLEQHAKVRIQEAVSRYLNDNSPENIAGFASGARGGDILFHEICRVAGIKTAILLPFGPDEFVKTSVAGVPTGGWAERFWSLWRDKEMTVVRDHLDLPRTNEAYGTCNTRLMELAREHGQLHVIALWDGKAGDGPGGTADVVKKARDAGDEPEIIATGDLSVT